MMDPNQWRYNQTYGHMTHQTGLSAAQANLNRFDLPLLNADQTALGLGLGNFSHAATRPVSSIPSVAASYPHSLHGSLLDAVSQNQYKSPFMDASNAFRSTDQSSLYGITTTGHTTKQVYPDTIMQKEQCFSSQNPSTEKLAKNFGWNALFNTSEFITTNLQGPPPAHSGNSNSRSSLQRSDSQDSVHKTSDLLLASQNAFPGLRPDAASILLASTSKNFVDIAKPSMSNYNYGINTSISKSDTSQSYQQSLILDMYDPVSPPTPSVQENDEGPFDTVNMQELGLSATNVSFKHKNLALDNTTLKSKTQLNDVSVMQNKNFIQSMPSGNIGMRNFKINEAFQNSISPNSSLPNQSPLHQSPQMSVASQPHTCMQQSSTSLVHQPPLTVQAVADSTTKPKKPRARKKKDQLVKEVSNLPPQQTKFTDSPKQCMQIPSSQNMGNFMELNHGSYNTYSPQRQQQPFSPMSTPAQQPSPKKSHTASPQNFSPKVTGQINAAESSVLQKNRSGNDCFSLPPVRGQNSSLHSRAPANMQSLDGSHVTKVQSSHMGLASNNIMCNNQSPLHGMTKSSVSMSPSPSVPGQHSNHPVIPLAEELSMPSRAPMVNTIVSSNSTYSYDNLNNQSFSASVSEESRHGQLTGSKAPTRNLGALPPLELPDHASSYVSHQGSSYLSQPSYLPSESQDTGPLYPELESYQSSQYESQPSSISSPLEYQQHSTIDEAALSSLIRNNSQDSQPGALLHGNMPSEIWSQQQQVGEEEDEDGGDPPKAITTDAEFDEEFQHLKKVNIPELKKQKPVGNGISGNGGNLQNQVPFSAAQNSTFSSANTTKSFQNNLSKKNQTPSSGFLNSFLSFIQGEKLETLSNLHTAKMKKPELPKYIPEPRRPRPEPPKESLSSKRTRSTEPSDNEEDNASRISSTSENSNESKVENRGGLKLKFSLKGHKKHVGSVGGVRKHTKKSRKKSLSKHGSDEEYHVAASAGEDRGGSQSSVLNSEPRRTSSRKAKEQGLQKRKKYEESDSDDAIPGPIGKEEAESEYDSDNDPAWTPFKLDSTAKKTPDIYDASSFYGVPRKSKSTKPKRRRSRGSVSSASIDHEVMTPASSLKPPPDPVPCAAAPDNSVAKEEAAPLGPPGFAVGQFIMAKKDLEKSDSYPIWKIDGRKMMRKYELVLENGQVFHKASLTYANWEPSLQIQYLPLRVKVIAPDKDAEVVEVHENDRPRQELDRKLEQEYEEDPLADLFNVYLQVFLSQALEPGFLSAISEGTGETEFYRGPLETIDQMIRDKLQELELVVSWKDEFKNALRSKPHLKELDRPNLKQACQACEDVSQPAIKSVHLYGQQYDPQSLQDEVHQSPDSVEFMIGRHAANHSGTYHDLYHFKHKLYKRCIAKVLLVRQNEKDLDNAEILDRCLNNRSWVLKIFHDLKKLLEKR